MTGAPPPTFPPAPPAYVPEPGPDALARRLRALLVANVPVACGVYCGLAKPGPLSARHAEATYARATHLAAGTVGELPHFNTNPPPILRILAAASRGRADAMGRHMAALPADLASDLWRGVEARLRAPAGVSPQERPHASDLLLRLGYVDDAAELLGIAHADAATHEFGADSVLAEFAVLARGRHDRAVLEARALGLARDRSRPPRVRTVMATYVVVRNGKRGTDTPDLHEAARLAVAAAAEADTGDFASCLSNQTVHRAIAFLPFLRRDLAGTLAHLDRALACQDAARAYAKTDLGRLAWIDHAFPLHETIARTHLRLGDVDAAIDATDELVALSPNDSRGWDLRGQALVKAGRYDEALVAWGRAIPPGGLPVAKAAYHLGWIHEQLGDPDRAREHYRLSWRIDPTVPVVAARLARAPA